MQHPGEDASEKTAEVVRKPRGWNETVPRGSGMARAGPGDRSRTKWTTDSRDGGGAKQADRRGESEDRVERREAKHIGALVRTGVARTNEQHETWRRSGTVRGVSHDHRRHLEGSSRVRPETVKARRVSVEAKRRARGESLRSRVRTREPRRSDAACAEPASKTK